VTEIEVIETGVTDTTEMTEVTEVTEVTDTTDTTEMTGVTAETEGTEASEMELSGYNQANAFDFRPASLKRLSAFIRGLVKLSSEGLVLKAHRGWMFCLPSNRKVDFFEPEARRLARD
jgi:hypothetical protein